jgi:arylsulfatase A-like enzyme
MKGMGLVSPEQQLARATGFDSVKQDPHDFHCAIDNGDLPEWDSLTETEQDELDFRRDIYAAQVEQMDQNIGHLVDHLRQHGLLDNTLLMFMSDNGCSGELGPFGCNWPEYHSKNYEKWKSEGGWATSQGQCWASLSNTPLRKYKIFVHEGGIASPFIAHWPAGIKEPGALCREQVFHLIDIMPTLCEVGGADYPDTFRGKSITPLEGTSMCAFFSGKGTASERTLFWQHEVNAAVREGPLKLVTSNVRDPSSWELYDLSEDRSESCDMREERPDVVERLTREWRRWAGDTDVLPWPEERSAMRRVPWPPT